MKRTATNHNMSFAVLVAAYVFVCAAVPSAASPTLSSAPTRDGRPIAIRISGSFSPAGVVFARQNPTRSGGGFLAGSTGGGRHVWVAHDTSLIKGYESPFATYVASRISTGALTSRFLAAS